jgi:hypothetical protein
MSHMFRLIWRLDFDINPRVLDGRGQVLSILLKEHDGFWTHWGEHPKILGAVFAEYRGDDGSRNLTVESTSINGSLDWYQPRKIDAVRQGGDFKTIDNLMKQVCDAIALKVVKRAGIRFFCLANRKEDPAGRLGAYLSGMKPEFRSLLEVTVRGLFWCGD